NFTCAITGAGVMCWGAGSAGQLAGGNTMQSTVPAPAMTGAVLQVAAGQQHVCAVVPGGAVECWGFDANGRLGLGNALFAPSPVLVKGVTGALEIAVGADHSC